MDLNLYSGSLSGGDYCALRGPTAGVLGSWHFLAGTFNSSTGSRCYLDEMSGSQDYLGNISANSQPLQIGGSNGAYFNGLIDEVAIFNKALSAETIRNIQCAMGVEAGTSSLPTICAD